MGKVTLNQNAVFSWTRLNVTCSDWTGVLPALLSCNALVFGRGHSKYAHSLTGHACVLLCARQSVGPERTLWSQWHSFGQGGGRLGILAACGAP